MLLFMSYLKSKIYLENEKIIEKNIIGKLDHTHGIGL